MATTIHHIPSDGSVIARGTATVADGDTVNTGQSLASGFKATSTADTVISATSITAGIVTVGVHTAGVASTGTKTIYWKAWNLQKV